MVGIFYTHHQHSHTEEKGRLPHFPLSLTPREEVLQFLHGSETMESLHGSAHGNNTLRPSFIHGFLYFLQQRVCKVVAYQFITEDGHQRYDQEQQPFLCLKMLQDIFQEQLSKGRSLWELGELFLIAKKF